METPLVSERITATKRRRGAFFFSTSFRGSETFGLDLFESHGSTLMPYCSLTLGRGPPLPFVAQAPRAHWCCLREAISAQISGRES
jgi:hypothetical protein